MWEKRWGDGENDDGGVLNLVVRPPGTRDELRREDTVCDWVERGKTVDAHARTEKRSH